MKDKKTDEIGRKMRFIEAIKKNKIIGVTLIILNTLIIMAFAILMAFVLTNPEKNQYYEIQTEEQLNNDYLLVKILNHSDNSPLQNVTIKVLEHGEGRLLSGPYHTNKSGYTVIQIPQGYDEYFDIVGEYKDITNCHESLPHA